MRMQTHFLMYPLVDSYWSLYAVALLVILVALLVILVILLVALLVILINRFFTDGVIGFIVHTLVYH